MDNDDNKKCEHSFLYGGVKFEDTDKKFPGSGARYRRYYDFYYCVKCLEKKYENIPTDETTYDKVLFGASPKP